MNDFKPLINEGIAEFFRALNTEVSYNRFSGLVDGWGFDFEGSMVAGIGVENTGSMSSTDTKRGELKTATENQIRYVTRLVYAYLTRTREKALEDFTRPVPVSVPPAPAPTQPAPIRPTPKPPAPTPVFQNNNNFYLNRNSSDYSP